MKKNILKNFQFSVFNFQLLHYYYHRASQLHGLTESLLLRFVN